MFKYFFIKVPIQRVSFFQIEFSDSLLPTWLYLCLVDTPLGYMSVTKPHLTWNTLIYPVHYLESLFNLYYMLLKNESSHVLEIFFFAMTNTWEK